MTEGEQFPDSGGPQWVRCSGQQWTVGAFTFLRSLF